MLRPPIESKNYTSLRFSQLLADNGIRRSMGSVGDSFDNALMENFWSTLKIEAIYGKRWSSPAQVEEALFLYVDGWYNSRRIQKKLGYRSPEEKDVEHDGDQITVTAATRTIEATCPTCGFASRHLRSRYERTLTDMGPALSAMRIRLTVKRFRCPNTPCGQATFAEQVEGLTGRYQRTTPAAQEVINRLGAALAGRAGARIAAMLGIICSRHTLLRAVRALPDPEPPEAFPVIGIDDFAFRKRHTYGTVIVDQQGRRVLEVLPDRSAETAAWLIDKKGIEVVCRDRAAAYGAAITAAQPDAIQIGNGAIAAPSSIGSPDRCGSSL